MDISIISPSPAVLGIFSAATGSTRNLFVGRGAQDTLTIQNGSTLTGNATDYSFIGLNAVASAP